MEATVAQALFTAAMLLIFGGFLVWAVKTRQFRDVEEPNVRLFSDDDDTTGNDPAPSRVGSGPEEGPR